MKMFYSKILIIALILTMLSVPVTAQESPVKVKIDGHLISFDVSPTVIEGRTVVPVRAIFEALGVKVGWNGETRTVIGTKGDIEVKLPIDSKVATTNGETIQLDVPATVINNRALVPVRFIAESIGAKVGWKHI